MKGICRRSTIARCVATAALAWTFCVTAPRAAPGPAPVPFVGAGDPVVRVTVSGAGPYSFLVDTGSSHSAVSTRVAAALGLPRVAKTRLSSAGGEQWAAVDRIDRLELGPLARPLLATELPDEALGIHAGVDGVVGLDLLGQRPFCLDYAARRLSWAWPSTETGVVDLPLDTRGPVWLTQASSGARDLHLVPDSGADGLVLFDRGQLAGVSYRAGTIGVSTVTSGTVARAARLSRLNLDRLAFVDVPVAVVDGRGVGAEHGDGLLPLSARGQACFDPAGGRLRLVGSSSAAGEMARLGVARVPAE